MSTRTFLTGVNSFVIIFLQLAGSHLGDSLVGLMGPPPRGLLRYPGLLHPVSLLLWQATADPEETLQHNSGSVSVGSLGACVH